MNKPGLIKSARITTNAMAKLEKNEDVRVEVLVKICRTLHCTLDDIVEIFCLTNKQSERRYLREYDFAQASNE